MNKVLAIIFLSGMLLLAGCLVAGQDAFNSLDNQLIVAAARGDTAAVQQLLQQGAHIEATDKWGSTPLLQAVQNGKIEVVKLLLGKGANIEAASGDGTSLILAAAAGNIEIVQVLLEKGANTGATDGSGDTALLKAVNRRDNNLVKLLLEKGANTQAKNRNGFMALYLAASGGNVEGVKLLLEKGAKDSVDGMALHGAAGNGQAEVVKLLLEHGANTAARDRLGYTALLAAAEQNKANAVKQLLEGGAKLDARDDHGETALHLAAHRGSTAVVELLLDKGANIEVRANDGFTPLLCAAEAGGIAHAGTPFYVEKFPAVEVINLLLDRGANVEAKSVDGQTALHRAAFRDRPDAVKALLARGANIQAMDNLGHTPLTLAMESLRGFERLTAQRPCNQGPSCQQSVDIILADKREVVRVLQEALAQHPPSTFADYVSDLQNHPRDRARRDNVVKLAAALPTPPPIPEEARRAFDRASELMKQANGPEELEAPINLLRRAVIISPWWGEAYHNLSRALELTGQYDLAVKNLNYYLELNPPEAEARAARAHLSEIQTEQETAVRKKQ
jgi:ankyrin repeat protein